MLVHLKLKQCSFEKMDKRVTEEVLDSHAAGAEAGTFVKKLIPKEAKKPVENIIGVIRGASKAQTLPFDDTHWRILTTSNFHNYNEVMNYHGQELERRVNAFCDGYDYWKERAKVMLNGMYNEADYHSREEIKEGYRMSINFREVPKHGNFLMDLADETNEALKKSIQDDTERKFIEGQKELWQRVLNVTSAFTEAMSKEARECKTPKGDIEYRAPYFKNSIAENIREVTELVPRLNLTGDSELNKLAADINQTLLACSPQELRDNPAKRTAAAQAGKDKVDAIQAAMAGVFA